mmetsp:Transcript_26428/g.41470  ORF Transcript_26428/g.41470 Transcript_26428/m.41470 type:complete len:152 (+) Transcript_26428:68-523(+)
MTVTDTKPSAPPLDDEEIPVVVATAIPTTADVPTTSVTASVLSANTQPQPAAAPPGMSMVSKTTTYPDGRTVTITEYVPKNPNAAPGPSPPAPARPAATAHRPPRRDLGSWGPAPSPPVSAANGSFDLSRYLLAIFLFFSVLFVILYGVHY